MPILFPGSETPNIWKISLPRITMIDMAMKARKRPTPIGAMSPQSPGNRERGNASSTDMNKEITKPTTTAGKT